MILLRIKDLRGGGVTSFSFFSLVGKSFDCDALFRKSLLIILAGSISSLKN